ncbi:hypothetical protein WNY78_03215 [Psychroserpens sp. AS72]|uniref:hypothetical protein n=1 Tax=Psychroserpens sp. AS72 TaxID=3135775 RepID=UPI003172D0FC
MTRLLTTICFITLLVSCKSDSKDQNNVTNPISEEKNNTSQEEEKLTVAQEIGFAYGLENWVEVTQVDFTFNVDNDGKHFERSWSWNPKTDDVKLTSGKDIITYNRKSLDSVSLQADKSFINDKFWLLAPYQIVWDEGTTISELTKEIAPISKTELNKITVLYANEGGYTPGDAYDFYFDKRHEVKEWIFRKGNSKEPTMITTFENYAHFNGIKIAKDHIKPQGNWKLYFTNITVK